MPIRDRLAGCPRLALVGVVRAYRLLLRPMLGNRCRFEPSCSEYALRALDAHGAAAGSYLTLRRIARCHPFCEGGHDPVPAALPPPFHRAGTSSRFVFNPTDKTSP